MGGNLAVELYSMANKVTFLQKITQITCKFCLLIIKSRYTNDGGIMKIAIVCDVLGEENNGATHAAMNFIRSLKAKGHQVNIICADQDKKGQEGYFVCPNINFGIFKNYVKKIGVTVAKADIDVIEEGIKGADIVHLHLPFFMSNKAIPIAQKYDIPMTASFHMQAENFTSYLKMQKVAPLNNSVYKFIWKHTYQYVDAVHYPTEFIRDIFEKKIKHKTNAYVISNGVNKDCVAKQVEKPDDLKDKFVIMSAGRYANEKAQDVLIKAVAQSKYRDKIQLILAGQGSKAKYYKKLSEKVGVTPIFKLFDREALIDAINFADLFVHPARIELEGIACLEAISMGKPTIVSDSKKAATSGFAVDDRCVFKNNDPKSLAEKIDYLIEHDDERIEIGKKYLASAKYYDQELCMDEMEKMLYDAIEYHKLHKNEIKIKKKSKKNEEK